MKAFLIDVVIIVLVILGIQVVLSTVFHWAPHAGIVQTVINVAVTAAVIKFRGKH